MDLEKVFKIEKKQISSIESLISAQNRPLPMEVLVDCLGQKIKDKIAAHLTFKVYDPDNNYLEGDNIYWKKNNFFGRVINRQEINKEHTLIEILWDSVLSGKPADHYLKKNKNVRVFYLINGEADASQVDIYKQDTRRKMAENQIDTNDIACSLYSHLTGDRRFVNWRRKWFLRESLTPLGKDLFERIIKMVLTENTPVYTKDIISEIFGVKEKDIKYPSLSFSVNYHLSRRAQNRVRLISTRGDGEWASPEWVSRRIPKLPDFIDRPRISHESLSTYISREYFPHDIQYIYNKNNSRYSTIFDASPIVREYEPLERILGFWEYQTGKIVLSNIEKLYFPNQHRILFVEQHTGKEFECFYDYEKGIIGGLEKWIALNMIPGGELEFRDLGYGDKFELRWRRSKKTFDYSPLRYAIASGELVEDGSKVEVRCGINRNFFIEPDDYGEIKDLFAWVKNPKLSIDNIIHELFVRFGPKIKIEKLATYFSILTGPWIKTCMAVCSSVIASDNGFLQGRGEKGNGIFHFDEEQAGPIQLKDEYDLVKSNFDTIMKGENEAVHFYGGEACLRVIFRDYSYWIRLKDQNSIKESIESQKAQALEFVKTNLKKTVLKKADKDFFINLIEDMSKKYLDLPIEIEKMDESDFALLKKALLHIVENPKKSAKNMEDILLPQGKYHIPAVQANFYFWILQMFDPSLYIGFNDNLENKLIKTHLLKWDSLADDITRFSCLCELMKIVKRVRPAYDAFDFMSALDFAVDTKGVVYLDQMLNDVIREEVKLNDINTRRDERLKEAKTRRELKKLQEEAEKARRTYEAEKKEKEKTEKVKAISEAASLESAKKSDATSKSDKSAKPSHTSADHTADASMVPMDSVFDVFEKSGIKFTTVARFLKPQISKRLSKIHTSLKNIRPFNIDSAENYANTLYWYWIDWLWKFIVQQKRSLKMDLSNIPEVSGIDNKTLAVIGAVRELMAEEGMTPNFDEIKYKLIMELKALVHSGSIKLKNYEMTDFTDVPVIDKKSSSESVQSKEDKNRAADFKKYCKQAQACVKCPLIPNIKCNIFNDGSDGYGKITAISLGGSQKDIINARIFLIADLPASDRSDFTDNSQENIFLRAIKGTGLNPKDFAGTFIAKCSAIGDKINRTMMSNCMDHLKREIELISPEAIIVLGENAGNHLKLEKGKWSKFNSKDIYLVKNSQDIYKEKINPEGLVKEILQAFAKIS